MSIKIKYSKSEIKEMIGNLRNEINIQKDQSEYLLKENQRIYSELANAQNKIELQETETHRSYITKEDFLNLFDKDFVSKNKIRTIKSIRTITGWGLKETKEFVEGEFNDKFINPKPKNTPLVIETDEKTENGEISEKSKEALKKMFS